MAINNETYFEFDDILNEGFTTIPNCILNDTRLTYKALGVYCQILQYKNSGKHKIYLKTLSQMRLDKRTAVSSALKELETCGYISREYIRNEKGQIVGLKYTVRMKPIETVENTSTEPKVDFQTSGKEMANKPKCEIMTSDNTTLKIKYNKNKNKVVVVSDETNPEDKKLKELERLYRHFGVEKRVMPQTRKLLKDNLHISTEVFEEIFITLSGDDVKKKYAYLKAILKVLNKNNIKTLTEFNNFNEEYKASKEIKNTKIKNSAKSTNSSKTKFHNFEERSNKDFDAIIKANNEKFKNEKDLKLEETAAKEDLKLEEKTDETAPAFNPSFKL
jgi:hypothetical protein